MGGVVSVAQIIDKATVEVADSSGKQFEIARDWKIIMQAVVPVGQSGECIASKYVSLFHLLWTVVRPICKRNASGHVPPESLRSAFVSERAGCAGR